MSKHILFVEDELAQQDMFETALHDWNKSSEEKQFTYLLASNVEEACEALERVRCDAALFDLRVKSLAGGKADASGNGLARKALRELGIPVAIISANSGELDEDVRDAGAVKVFGKTGAPTEERNYYEQALAWLGSEWDMMETLGAARKAIDGAAADIFLRRLWPKWKSISEIETENREELVRIVTRQYAGHIADSLGLDDPANVSWHPFENYVSPSLLSHRAHTGDIFRFGEKLWVVLSPQCDMATQKISNVILASCDSGIPDWDEMVEAFRHNASAKKAEKGSRFLLRHVNQNLEPSRHFLPPLPGDKNPLLVHFSSVMTLPLEELNGALHDRVASIASPFLSNIVQRFGSYLSRTGQPNIDIARF